LCSLRIKRTLYIISIYYLNTTYNINYLFIQAFTILIIYKLFIVIVKKAHESTHMGVSKGEGGGRWSPPNGWRSLVLGEGDPCRIWRSGGFPNFPGKSSPSSLSQPFFTLFLPLDLFLQFFHPSNASLQLSSSSLYQPLLPSPPSFFPSNPALPSKSPIGPPPNTSGIPP